MWIERPPEFFRRLVPAGEFRIHPQPGKNSEEKTIYLTFDDGPIPEITPWVLNTLDAYKAKATFFMVGENAQRHPELVAEVRKRGHSIGNHTMHHLRGSHVTTFRYLHDVAQAEELLNTRLMRPPHGWLRPRQAKALRKKYRIIMYDLVTRDYSKRVDAERVVKNVKRYTRNGSIIVFHDSLKSMPKLYEALPQALEWLTQQGYRFEIIPQE